MRILRGIVKCLVALFCLWHMAAIGVFALQNVDKIPALKWLEGKQGVFRTYVLITSQWQRWNLFSPDPLRRVSNFRIELHDGENWQTYELLDLEHLEFFRRASELKVMRRMEEDQSDPLRDRYMQELCHRRKLLDGQQIRLIRRYHVVPHTEGHMSVAWWHKWQPEWTENVELETSCDSQKFRDVSSAPKTP